MSDLVSASGLRPRSIIQAANCSASMRYMRRDEGASWPSASASAATRSSCATAEKGTTLAIMKHHLLLVDYRLSCTHSDLAGHRIDFGDRDSQADGKERNPFLF